MTGTMKGICKMRPAVGAEYRTDIPIPQIGDDDVLMKVHATAICGTDLHIYKRWRPTFPVDTACSAGLGTLTSVKICTFLALLTPAPSPNTP